MAKSTDFQTPDRWVSANDTLTSGITKADPSLPIATVLEQFSPDGIRYRTKIRVNNLKKAIAADAALGFGEQIASFPLGIIRPVGGYIALTSTCATGLSATAGEIGLGSTIASGAIATLGAGSAAMENLMEGTTISNHVAATALVSRKANNAVANAGAAFGTAVLDGTATAAKIHLNIASTWDQTAAESVTFGGLVILDWVYLGVGDEV
jgi:hypothetical protein